MKITVIGAGNAGLIHAAKLIERGHEVCIFKSSSYGEAGLFKSILNKKKFKYINTYKGEVDYKIARPKKVTLDVEEAVTFGEMLFVFTTVSQHEYIANLIAPYVRDSQIIVLCPSYMSSLLFKRIIDKKVVYSEWETTAYNGRIVNHDYVNITFYNPRNATSIMPNRFSKEVLRKLTSCFPNTKYLRKNSLETAVHNPNMIVHTIGVTLSASRIEYSGGDFWMYKEAFTPSIVRVIREFDRQKNAILQVVGCKPLDYFEAAHWRNELDLTKDSFDVFMSFAESSNIGPTTLNHRYLTEDVPMGLVLFSSIGKCLGLSTSIADSIITLASSLLGVDLWKEGRDINYLLGTSNVQRNDLLEILNTQ